jgi:hypothetical protein
MTVITGVGTSADVYFIVGWFDDYYHVGISEPPPGWEFLSINDTWRRLVVRKGGVVYKIAFVPRAQDENDREYTAVQYAHKNPLEGYYVPNVEPYELYNQDGEYVNVLAMEYIEGPHIFECWTNGIDYEFPDHGRSPEYEWGFDDLHEENMIVMDDGRIAIIDLGGSP